MKRGILLRLVQVTLAGLFLAAISFLPNWFAVGAILHPDIHPDFEPASTTYLAMLLSLGEAALLLGFVFWRVSKK